MSWKGGVGKSWVCYNIGNDGERWQIYILFYVQRSISGYVHMDVF